MPISEKEMPRAELDQTGKEQNAVASLIQVMREAINGADQKTKAMRNLVVQAGGRAKVITALGDDATEFIAAYRKLKKFVEDHSDLVIEDI